jgi:hypothetical protein
MSNRGCLFLLLLPPLLSNANYASGQNIAVQVQVYDYTNLKPAALAELVGRTQEILVRSGVSVQVDACPHGISMPCRGLSGTLRKLTIRVIPKATSNGIDTRWQHLGAAIAGHNGGSYGTIFLKLAQEKASETNLPPAIVLAYAAVHEIGHLLLGDQAHAAQGLMKAHWVADDFWAMAQGQLRFTREQIQELTERYGTSRRDEPAMIPRQPREGGPT